MLEQLKKALLVIQHTPAAIDHFNTYPPIFIIGSPRSGTTLTLKLFEGQPQISNSLEPFKFWKTAFRTSQDDTFSSSANVLGFQVLRYLYYCQLLKDKPSLVVKDPRDSIRVNYIRRLFPKAKFIHVIRDGRDVIASMLKTFSNEVYWTDNEWPHVRIPGYKNLFNNASYLNAATQWKYCVETSLSHLADLSPAYLFTFYYEDLVAHPKETATDILSFSGIDIDEKQLYKVTSKVSSQVVRRTDFPTLNLSNKTPSWAERMQRYSSLVIDDAGSGTTSESLRVGRWKTELSDAILAECYPIIEDTLKRLGYK